MASMNVANYRMAIADAYPGDMWRARVNAMPDNQVIAIYNHFVRDGVFRRLANKRKQERKRLEESLNPCRQMTLWDDFGIEKNTGHGIFKKRHEDAWD